MVSQGYFEVSTLAFYSDADLDALHIAEDAKERNVIRLLNPITTNLSIMRTTLAPSMLNTVVENVKKGNTALLDKLNKAYAELKASGEVDKIYKKWFQE